MQKILLALLGIGFSALMSAGVSAHECGHCWVQEQKKIFDQHFQRTTSSSSPHAWYAVNN